MQIDQRTIKFVVMNRANGSVGDSVRVLIGASLFGGTTSVMSDLPDPAPGNNVAVATTEVDGPPNPPPACDHVPPEAKPPICR